MLQGHATEEIQNTPYSASAENYPSQYDEPAPIYNQAQRTSPTPASRSRPSAKPFVPEIRSGEVSLDNLSPCYDADGNKIAPPCFKSITKNSAAERLGIQAGDQLISVDNISYLPVSKGTPQTIAQFLNRGYKRPVTLHLRRGRQDINLTLSWGFLWAGLTPAQFRQRYK